MRSTDQVQPPNPKMMRGEETDAWKGAITWGLGKCLACRPSDSIWFCLTFLTGWFRQGMKKNPTCPKLELDGILRTPNVSCMSHHLTASSFSALFNLFPGPLKPDTFISCEFGDGYFSTSESFDLICLEKREFVPVKSNNSSAQGMFVCPSKPFLV